MDAKTQDTKPITDEPAVAKAMAGRSGWTQIDFGELSPVPPLCAHPGLCALYPGFVFIRVRSCPFAVVLFLNLVAIAPLCLCAVKLLLK